MGSANRSWMIHMQKELCIVLKSGVEYKWKRNNIQVKAELHTRVIFAKDVNTVIVKLERDDDDQGLRVHFQLTELEMRVLQLQETNRRSLGQSYL